MKFLVVNGPNLNMLGLREPEIYGKGTYADLVRYVEDYCSAKGAETEFFQSNHEGELIDRIQAARGIFDGIVLNAGAYTHYSYAILDAIRASEVPTVEVHLSDVNAREPFRSISVIRPACVGIVSGLGFDSYTRGVDLLLSLCHE